jgi:hypothetical protein
MLAGIQRPLKKLRERVAPDMPEAFAIDQQLASFEERRLVALAKAALLTRQFSDSGAHLQALYRHTGAVSYRILAFLADQAPFMLAGAYALKRAANRHPRLREYVRRPASVTGRPPSA